MNKATLDTIVDTSHFVKDEITFGCEKAKQELETCLPIERIQFEELARDKKTDFRKGYDDKYPRIDMKVVLNSVKEMNGHLVPAFANYEVLSHNNECNRRFSITNTERYVSQTEINKRMVPHFPFIIKLANYFYRTTSNESVIPFVVFGMFCQLGLITLLTKALVPIIIGSLFSFVGICMITWGMAIFKLEPGFSKNRNFSHKFSGVIPQNVRDLISSEKSKFDSVLLVEEAHCWKINDETVSIPKNPDPLIIGKKDDIYYLLAKFDVTPLENLIATEYSN